MCLVNNGMGILIVFLLLWNWNIQREKVFLMGIPFFLLPSINCLTVEVYLGVWFCLFQALGGLLVMFCVKDMRLNHITIGLTLCMSGLVLLNSIYTVIALMTSSDLSNYPHIAGILWLGVITVLLLGGVFADACRYKSVNTITSNT